MTPADALTAAAATGAGLGAGVYLAFSTIVMPGLRTRPPAQAVGAMNAVNRAAPRDPVLMLVLFGTGVLCVAVLVVGIRDGGNPAAGLRIAGAVLYLVSVAILLGYHVPHNDRLRWVDPAAADAGESWSRFHTGWTGWNHARTLAAAAGAACLAMALGEG